MRNRLSSVTRLRTITRFSMPHTRFRRRLQTGAKPKKFLLGTRSWEMWGAFLKMTFSFSVRGMGEKKLSQYTPSRLKALSTCKMSCRPSSLASTSGSPMRPSPPLLKASNHLNIASSMSEPVAVLTSITTVYLLFQRLPSPRYTPSRIRMSFSSPAVLIEGRFLPTSPKRS